MNISQIAASTNLLEAYKNLYSDRIQKQHKDSQNNNINGIDSEELLKRINKTNESEETEQITEKSNTEELIKNYVVPEAEKTDYEKLVGTLLDLKA